MKNKLYSILSLLLLVCTGAWADGEVAQIGEKKYATLAEAIAAVDNDETIKLLSDITLDEITYFRDNKTFTIDGDGHTVSPTEGASLAQSLFEVGHEETTPVDAMDITFKNLIIKGYNITADYAAIFRLEGGKTTLYNVTFDGNTSANNIVIVRNSTLTADSCTFKSNIANCAQNSGIIYADEKAGTSITITRTLFESNTETGNGLLYVSDTATGTIKSNTFRSNTVGTTSTGNAAVIYGSGIIDVENNLFESNIVTAHDVTKLGMVVLGSESAGDGSTTKSYVKENAFVNNTIGNENANWTYGVYTGHAQGDLTANYWVDGTEPDWAYKASGKDIYVAMESGFTAPETYADAYTVNENGRGVTVSIHYVAEVTDASGNTTKYPTLDAAIKYANTLSGATVTLLADIDGGTATTTVNEKIYTYGITSNVIIDGNGHSVVNTGTSTNTRAVFGVYGGAGSVNVTFKNINITSKKNSVIETQGGIGTLTLDGASLTATKGGEAAANPAGLRVDGTQTTNANIVIINSTLDGTVGGYPTKFYNPVTLTVTNTTFTGYSSLYFKGGARGSVATVNGSTLSNITSYNGTDNDFGSVVLEDDGINVTLTDCDIKAYCTGTAKQAVFLTSAYASHKEQTCTLTINGNSKVRNAVLYNEAEPSNPTAYPAWPANVAKVVTEDGVYYESPDAYVPENKVVIMNTDPETMEVYPYTIALKSANRPQETEAKSDYTINGTPNTEASVTTEQKAAVDNALGTTTEPNISVDNFANGVKASVDETTQSAISTNKNYVRVKLTAAITSSETSYTEGSTTVSTEMHFDVKPVYEVTDGSTTKEVEIPNDVIKKGITFRLPVDKNVTATDALTFHKTESLGLYPIKGDATNGKYIEITSSEFSEFSYTLMSSTDVKGTIYTAANTAGIADKSLVDFATTRKTYPNAVMVVDQTNKDCIVGIANVMYNNGTINVCPELELKDLSEIDKTTQKADFYTPVNFTAHTGSYTRTLDKDYSTSCVPFAISEDAINNSNIQIMTYKTVGTSDVIFGKVTELNAGVACLLYSTAKDQDITINFDDTPILAAPAAKTDYMVGTFASANLAGSATDNKYSLLSDGSTFGTVDSTIWPFRAILDLSATSGSGAKASFLTILAAEDVATGVKNVDAMASTSSAQANGKFIENGRIVILKNGKKYSAAGQEVK